MALSIRNQDDALIPALVQQHNALRVAVTKRLTTYPHADVTSKDAASDLPSPASTPDIVSSTSAPADLAHVITLGLEAQAVYGRHIADTNAHAAADATNMFTTALATTAGQSAVNTWLNSFKAAFNLHLAQAGKHYTNDTTNAIVAADASNLATSKTLVAAIATAINAHVQFALDGAHIVQVGP